MQKTWLMRYLHELNHIGAPVMQIKYQVSSFTRDPLSNCIAGAICTVLMASAEAGIQSNTIDPAGTFSDHGRNVVLTGPIACTLGQRADIQVTLTQRRTGAFATGRTHFTCTGYMQQWEVRAAVHGRDEFQPGTATVVAFGTTSTRGNADDAHQWLVQITLVN